MQDCAEMTVKLATGITVLCNKTVTLPVDFGNDVSCDVTFHVVPELQYACIFGMPWLKALNPTIDWVHGTVQLRPDVPAALGASMGSTRAERPTVELASLRGLLKAARQKRSRGAWLGLLRVVDGVAVLGNVSGDGTVRGKQDADTTQHASQFDGDVSQQATGSSRFDHVLDEFADVFASPGMPAEREIKHRIDLVDETAQPPRQRIYRMSQPELAEVRRQLDDLLAKGWIRPSSSPYGHPILFVRKKSGELRMCVDYRLLNKQTKQDVYPIPRIDALLDSLSGAAVFSLIDLRAGYHQVRIQEGHEFKTAFTSRWGLFEFVVMPFGLCNAPATFQRLMNTVLKEGLDRFVTVYLDDILVFSPDEASHTRHLRWVFEQLRLHKLFAKKSKCEIGLSEVHYLGHIVSKGQVKVDDSKISAVRDWPEPTSQKQVQQFLGLANYYNRFVPQFADVAAPLSDLLGKKVPFVWTARQRESFHRLKHALCHAPVLAMPDFARDFTLETDASDVAVGAVLEQDFGKGLQPIAYYSRKLDSAQRNYPVHEREQLAIVLALARWRPYVDGRMCRILTDHAPLVHLRSQPHLSKRQVRWMEKMEEFHYTIEYRPGPQAVVPDALSRPAEMGSLLLEPGWLARVHRAQHDPADAEMRGLLQTASGSSATFAIKQVGGLSLVYRQQDDRSLLVIPATGGLRELLMSELHDSLLGGHLGVRKTMLALQRRVWWPQMERIIKQYVRQCPVCQRTKDVTLKPAGELQPLPVPQGRFDSWSMDFITGLPLSGGYNAIYTVVDRLTKLVRLTPCTMGEAALTAGEVAHMFFERVVRDFGVPTSVISDRDPRFTGSFWTSLMSIMGTRLAFSTAFHPQSDGQTERAHRVIEQVLRAYIVERPATRWHEVLGHCEFALNSTPSASSGVSPFEMIYGQPIRAPADQLGGQHEVAAAQEVVDRVVTLVTRAREQLAKAQAYQKAAYDRRHRAVEFAAGQQVLLSTQNLTLPGSRKLNQRFIGPFRITDRVGTQAYRLALPQTYSQLHDVFHVSLLRPYVEPSTGQSRGLGLPVLVGQEEAYEIERVLRHRNVRGRGKGREFLVLWKGYDLSEASWVREADMGNARDILNDYLATL